MPGKLFSNPSDNLTGGREILNTIHRPTRNLSPSWKESCAAGKFVVTTEVAPPLSTATGKLKRDIEMVKDLVAAVNFTDSASASPRMSSMACSKVAAELGADPVLQIAARDKTRSGLQSDIVGANVMGVHNVLCITGDNARIGPTPTSNTNILDFDAVQMLWILRRMRDEGIYLDGRKMKSPPRLFLGAAASPFASEPKFQALQGREKNQCRGPVFPDQPDFRSGWAGPLAGSPG